MSIAARASRDAHVECAPILGAPLEIVSNAIGSELVGQELSGLCDMSPEESNRRMAVAALVAMRNHTLVFRDEGGVVHQLVGAPDDIWKTIIDGILSDDTGSERSEHRDAQKSDIGIPITEQHQSLTPPSPSEEKEETR